MTRRELGEPSKQQAYGEPAEKGEFCNGSSPTAVAASTTSAYKAGATGAEVKIGIVDTGIIRH